MSIDNRLEEYLEHMKRATSNAIAFVDGMEKMDFLCDVMVQNAVAMSLLNVGEAANRIVEKYPEFTQSNSHVPWHSMRGMRNRIAHGYFEINQEVVWETTQTALPDLLNQLDSLDHGATAELPSP